MSKTATAHTAKGEGQKEPKAPSRNLNPLKFPGVTPVAFRVLSRLIVLTKDGTQACVYTNAQAMTDLGLPEGSAKRAFSVLLNGGYISSNRTNSAFGINARQVQLTEKTIALLAKSSDQLDGSDQQKSGSSSDQSSDHLGGSDQSKSGSSSAKGSDQVGINSGSSSDRLSSTDGVGMQATEAPRLRKLNNEEINESEQRSHSPSNSSLSSSGPSGSDQLANEQEAQAQEGQASQAQNEQEGQAQGKQEQVAQTAQAGQAGQAQGWSSSDKEGTTRFDFADKLKSLGLEVSVINGKPSDLRYDFTWLQGRLSSNAKHDYKGVCQFAMKDGAIGIPYEWIHRFAEFVIVNEMANHSDQLFKAPESCDKYNKELVTEFFARNQSGILFTVIGSRWGAEWGPYFTEVDSIDEFSGQIEHDIYDVYWAGKEFVKQALYNFNLGDRSNPVKYLTRAVLYEVRNILRDPAAYQKAVKAVASEFFFNCRAQRWINSLHCGGEEYLRCYYPVSDYDMHRMLYEPARGQKIKMRFTYPYMLVRKWFTVFRASGYEDGGGDWSDDKSRELLYAIGHDAFNRTQWEECVKVFGAEYPFLTKLEFENV